MNTDDDEHFHHFYMSTYCLHAWHDENEELHKECRQTCKICETQCICQCHDREDGCE